MDEDRLWEKLGGIQTGVDNLTSGQHEIFGRLNVVESEIATVKERVTGTIDRVVKNEVSIEKVRNGKRQAILAAAGTGTAGGGILIGLKLLLDFVVEKFKVGGG